MDFVSRLVDSDELEFLLDFFGCSSSQDFFFKAAQINPHSIQNWKACDFKELEKVFDKFFKKITVPKACFVGETFAPCNLDPLIENLIFRNPGWYSAYTPYQPEISQGRLYLLYLFQKFFSDLTGLPISVASLLDCGSSLAEGIRVIYNSKKPDKKGIFFINPCFDSVKLVLKSRLYAEGFYFSSSPDESFCAVLTLPDKLGSTKFRCPEGLPVVGLIDPLFLIFKTPQIKELNLDIATGNCQRLGLPLWLGGPYPAYFCAKAEYLRFVPGRIVTEAFDAKNNKAYRLGLQTREQHIRREKATSNICTSQVLPAIAVTATLIFKGITNLQKEAQHVHELANLFQSAVTEPLVDEFFDTVSFKLTQFSKEANLDMLWRKLTAKKIFCYKIDKQIARVSFSHIHNEKDLEMLLAALGYGKKKRAVATPKTAVSQLQVDQIFQKQKTEVWMTRFLHRLQSKDYSHLHGLIPLGSCTMKHNSQLTLNFMFKEPMKNSHPFQPIESLRGFQLLLKDFEKLLTTLTGFVGCFFNSNSGAQGELAALLAIKQYFHSFKEDRNVVLIPTSSHGTNPASAVMAGFNVKALQTNSDGTLNFENLKAALNSEVAAVMITYPSVFGVFDPHIQEINELIHQNGSISYLDGANFNAFLGWLKPAELGFDCCHLNLHKTFGIPHGGGGPGQGPVLYNSKLAPFLKGSCPRYSDLNVIVSASPWGNASAMTISYSYLKLLGFEGCRASSIMAILKANFLKKSLEQDFKIITSENGLVAHEFVVDLSFLTDLGLSSFDFVKRLIDYGFHPPTFNWPLNKSLMIEPTETESLEELKNFAEAMISVKREAFEKPELLKNAPSAQSNQARYLCPVFRIDEAASDRALLCSCDI